MASPFIRQYDTVQIDKVELDLGMRTPSVTCHHPPPSLCLSSSLPYTRMQEQTRSSSSSIHPFIFILHFSFVSQITTAKFINIALSFPSFRLVLTRVNCSLLYQHHHHHLKSNPWDRLDIYYYTNIITHIFCYGSLLCTRVKWNDERPHGEINS